MKLIKVATGEELDDARTLAEHKVQNDDVLGLCFKKEDPSRAGGARSPGTCASLRRDLRPDSVVRNHVDL